MSDFPLHHFYVVPLFSLFVALKLSLATLHPQVSKNIELGLSALNGEKGAAYDRIVLNAGMVDHLLGCSGAEDVSTAMDRAREAIDSGKALKRLLNYIRISNKF